MHLQRAKQDMRQSGDIVFEQIIRNPLADGLHRSSFTNRTREQYKRWASRQGACLCPGIKRGKSQEVVISQYEVEAVRPQQLEKILQIISTSHLANDARFAQSDLS